MGSERRFLEGLQQAVLMTGNTLCNWPTHVSHGTRAPPRDIGPSRRNFSAFVTASWAARESPKFFASAKRYGRKETSRCRAEQYVVQQVADAAERTRADLSDCNVILANPYRKAVLLTGLLLGVPSMSIAADIPGVIKLPSRHSVAATIDRLEEILKQRAIVVFARIDFSGDAGRAGLSMRPEQMLIFGNPKAGTPLMVAVPAIGLDLPMKVLVWEDADGKVWAAYKDPKYLVRHYGVSADLAANLAAVVPIIERATAAE